MQYATTLIIAIMATIGDTSPTGTLQPRACTTITPSSMQSLLSTEPTIGFTNKGLNGPGGNGFSIFQDNTQANNRYQMLQFVDFEVPSGSYGCQLHVTDAGNSIGYHLLNGHEPSADPGMAKVTVMALVPNALSPYPSYDDVQTMDPSLVSAKSFGTFSIANGTVPGTINSEACPPAMSDGQNGHLQFVFELEGNDLSHTRYFSSKSHSSPILLLLHVSWRSRLTLRSVGQRSAGAGGALNGVYMTFNC
ncbi:hypothetical protein BKA65DRAFT_211857 [Rhexocercosporidium sp. MPI-PUGE-AT-0058]|nr:hypothetical protein BKA65DRAFT_211857 [Rhexocercosporidium sp. MPI-PUGE-AT-0058]